MATRGYRKQSLASTTSAVAWAITYGDDFQTHAITLSINTAPTSAGNITVHLNGATGPVLRTIDPVSTSATSVSIENLPGVANGDNLYVKYANPDNRTITGIAVADIDSEG